MNLAFLNRVSPIGPGLLVVLGLVAGWSLLGADAITTVMSPIASYQYAEDLSTSALAAGGVASPLVSYQYPNNLTSEAMANGGVSSPILSYQYFEWPGDSILGLQTSPFVSYYYQVIDAPQLNITFTDRTPTISETTPAYLALPPSQLMAYHGGIFTANLASIDPNRMTIVLTHGWIPLYPLTGLPIFTPNGVQDWPTDMAALLSTYNATEANIVSWNWANAAMSSVSAPGTAGEQTPRQGIALGQALLNVLGPNYSGKLHFIGHSFGTLVNAYAANFLQGNNWASEAVSSTPWPAVNMQMTLFDEAEVGTDKNFILNPQDLAALANPNANLLTASAYYHPLPKHFAWADNYVSAVGLLQNRAANVILTNGFPANASDPFSWFKEFGAFHAYPIPWYEETIRTDASKMGFLWSFERGGWFSDAPTAGTVYVQAFENTYWDLTKMMWSDAVNLLNARFQQYRGGLITPGNTEVPGLITANGSINGQIVGALPAFDAFTLSFVTTSKVGDPAYAWMQFVIPSNAVSMSFAYKVAGNWANDSLAAAFNGTNVLLMPGDEIQPGITFSTGSIDVSAFAGQTNEVFVAIVGSTSTNAELTIENLVFAVPTPPSLRVQLIGSDVVLSWPMATANVVLEISTNLADVNAWVALTNAPSIVGLQNTLTNTIEGGQGFYRLLQSP